MRDIRCCRGALGNQRIVSRVRSSQTEAGAGNCLAGADVLIAERGCAAREADIILAQYAAEAAAGNDSRHRAIVNLVIGTEVRGQAGRGYIRGGYGGSWVQHIVRRISSGQRQVGNAHLLASAHILIGETCRASGEKDIVVANYAAQTPAGNRGRRAAVIDFIANGYISGQRRRNNT